MGSTDRSDLEDEQRAAWIYLNGVKSDRSLKSLA